MENNQNVKSLFTLAESAKKLMPFGRLAYHQALEATINPDKHRPYYQAAAAVCHIYLADTDSRLEPPLTTEMRAVAEQLVEGIDLSENLVQDNQLRGMDPEAVQYFLKAVVEHGYRGV